MLVKRRLLAPFAGILLTISICSPLTAALQGDAPRPAISSDAQAALDYISADSLRGHLSFIASDLLEGRNTPSPGLDVAALYIAAQFRRAGLEPAGDDAYFQTARWKVAERPMEQFSLRIETGTETVSAAPTSVSVGLEGGLKLARAALFKLDYKDGAQAATLTPEQLSGKVLITEIPDVRREDRSRWPEMLRAQSEFRSRMVSLKPALVISIDRSSTTAPPGGGSRLIDPENRQPPRAAAGSPMITVRDRKIAEVYDAMSAGVSQATVSVDVPVPVEKPISIRNVVGLLRGSDPALKDTYVLVTAHYDHLGTRAGGDAEDRVFNGANDDGSGTVSVIELALALARLKERPKRSIVFITFFGEEKGLLGSRYYGRHPVFPIEKTVADINLEQVGRTDSSEGPQISNASMTGFDFSDVGPIFKAAGEATGVTVYKHPANSDTFFGRSDNQALADQGVPAHTLCVAFVYPDYHGVADHWEKIDYENMAKVDRMVALGMLTIANNPQEPKWNEANPKTERYVKAWKERRRP